MNHGHVRVIAGFVIAIVGVFPLPRANLGQKDTKPRDLRTGPLGNRPQRKPAKTGGEATGGRRGSTPEDPAVAAILATKPTTPAECVRAAKTLADLGHPDVAKPLLKKVLDAKLDPQQLADLGEQFGCGAFLDMAGQAALLPEAKQLADAVAAAVAARLEDAKRIAGLIGQLQDPQAEKRMQALAGLQAAGRAAIGPLLPCWPIRHAPPNTPTSARCWPAWAGRHAKRWWPSLEAGRSEAQGPGDLDAGRDERPESGDRSGRALLSEKSDAEVRAAAAAALKQLTGRVPTRPEAIALLDRCREDLFRPAAADRGRG